MTEGAHPRIPWFWSLPNHTASMIINEIHEWPALLWWQKVNKLKKLSERQKKPETRKIQSVTPKPDRLGPIKIIRFRKIPVWPRTRPHITILGTKFANPVWRKSGMAESGLGRTDCMGRHSFFIRDWPWLDGRRRWRTEAERKQQRYRPKFQKGRK